VTYNIISIDGGPAGLLPVLALQEIEKAVPGFLARSNLFAGTSSGAMTSLLLAIEDDPATQLPKAAYLWNNPEKLDHNDLFGYLKFFLGMGAMNSTKYMRQFLGDPNMLGDVRLSDLKKKVVMVSYRVAATPLHPLTMMDGIWRSKVFNNFGGPDDPDYYMKALDVAIASGSAPIFAPAYMGFVDGGVTANNPTMCALVQVHRESHINEQKGVKPLLTNDLRSARVLSLGGGRRPEVALNPFANWGYYNWLINPAHPLLVIGALMQGGTDAVSFQARNLLEANGFFRFDPAYMQSSLTEPHSSPKGQVKVMNSAATQELAQRAIRWVKECGWMDSDPEPHAVASAPSAEPEVAPTHGDIVDRGGLDRRNRPARADEPTATKEKAPRERSKPVPVH